MLWCRVLGRLVIVMTVALGEEEWEEDWKETTGEDREHRFLFPGVEQEEQCQGEKMVLRAGESTSIQSHRGYGYRPYPQDYRCRGDIALGKLHCGYYSSDITVGILFWRYYTDIKE